jgi:hypothetical protein
MRNSTLPTAALLALACSVAFGGERVRQLPAGPDESVTLYEGMANPYVASAGTEGFSSGPTADRAARAFARLDRDRSGSLHIDETLPVPGLERHFAAYDVNGDGEIAANEFQSWYAASGQFGDNRFAAGDDD